MFGDDIEPINRERFERWVEEKRVPILGDYSLGEPRSLVVLDNATIHHSDKIVQLVESTGARLVYLPPYPPDLNPIELMFGLYKARLSRLSIRCDWFTAQFIALHKAVSPEVATNIL